MVLPDLAPLCIRLLLVLFVMTMIGVENVSEFPGFVLCVHSLDVNISKLRMLKLLLDFLQLFRSPVVERMKELLQTLLLPRIRHVCSRALGSANARSAFAE